MPSNYPISNYRDGGSGTGKPAAGERLERRVVSDRGTLYRNLHSSRRATVRRHSAHSTQRRGQGGGMALGHGGEMKLEQGGEMKLGQGDGMEHGGEMVLLLLY